MITFLIAVEKKMRGVIGSETIKSGNYALVHYIIKGNV